MVPWEGAKEQAYEQKKPKYAELVADAQHQGWKAKVCPVEVGSSFFSHLNIQATQGDGIVRKGPQSINQGPLQGCE